MIDQAELFIEAPPLSPEARAEVERMVTALSPGDWLLARELLPLFGRQDTESDRRHLRSLAFFSSGRIGSGQPGYKMVTAMTADEFAHSANGMLSQCARMRQRVIEMQRVFYGRLGGRSE